MDLGKELIKFNQRLSSRGSRLRIEQRGELLNLRGPLPSRTNHNEFKTQRISLRLPVSTQGLQEAERIVEVINIQLKHNQFDWKYWAINDPYKKNSLSKPGMNEILKSFESSFFSSPTRKRSQAGSRTTWNSAYLPYFVKRRL